ncbi:MAG: UDP-N-acetylmuramate dehydrogenase [Sphingobacteriales bacterium]|nr:MAG: UDP-N-acetylmuramate dehydrogenase [Sphingobacteriales bacterium]
MQLQQNVSLKPYNTFGLDVPAGHFLEVTDESQLPEITDDSSLPAERHVLGGGSNVLLTKPVSGILLHNKIKGINRINEDADHVWLQIGAGEKWHDLVIYAINNDLAGLENLSLIPGTVGASPMQNIGAYGVEAKETIESVTAWHWQDKAFTTYSNEECQFGYRDSIFKNSLKDKVFITSVTFRLNKVPSFNTSYGAIEEELKEMGVRELSIRAISEAVIAIRTSKLPNPSVIGNAGSFFKNPTIPTSTFQQLKNQHPEIPSYPVDEQTVKVPAGWLIERCSWKGFRKGDAGVHTKQALVLVNYGHAKGEDIWLLSEDIIQSVQEKFGITLEREVQLW